MWGGGEVGVPWNITRALRAVRIISNLLPTGLLEESKLIPNLYYIEDLNTYAWFPFMPLDVCPALNNIVVTNSCICMHCTPYFMCLLVLLYTKTWTRIYSMVVDIGAPNCVDFRYGKENEHVLRYIVSQHLKWSSSCQYRLSYL